MSSWQSQWESFLFSVYDTVCCHFSRVAFRDSWICWVITARYNSLVFVMSEAKLSIYVDTIENSQSSHH